MLKFIREQIVDRITVADNIMLNLLIMALIALIAGVTTYWLVGRLYFNNIISCRLMGKIVYSLIWIFIVFCLSAIVAFVIWVLTLFGVGR